MHVASVDEEADILTKEYVGPNFRVLWDRAMGRTAMRGRLRQEYERARLACVWIACCLQALQCCYEPQH